MAISSENKIVDALAIRDTADHISVYDEISGFIPKTIIIFTTLNQNVDIQVQGCIDGSFSKPINIGSPVTVTGDDYIVLSDYFPHLRTILSCATSPTLGDITVYIAKVSS